tara:strand:+ start:492 stop:1289 length:798 start_codon:yes stop_codon:yes gene_type:complete
MKSNNKVEYNDYKLLKNLEFFSISDFSKVRNEKGYICDECKGEGVIYKEDAVTFCSRKKKIDVYNSSCIPSRYSKCKNLKLDNGGWVIRERSIQNALEYSIKYLDSYPKILPPFFVGLPGLGKTHLSVSIITELIFAYNQKCIFKQFRDLLSDIKDIYVKGLSEKEYVESLCAYDVIVIDDLGATRMSEWEISVLDNIIAKRYNSKKHTIFNSNLAFLNGKKFKATDSNQILDYKIGKRNISRIYEMSQILELNGDDFRVASTKS